VPIISISEPGIGHALRLGKQEELPFSAPVMLLGVDPHTMHMKIVINDTKVDDLLNNLSQSRTDTDDTDLKSTAPDVDDVDDLLNNLILSDETTDAPTLKDLNDDTEGIVR